MDAQPLPLEPADTLPSETDDALEQSGATDPLQSTSTSFTGFGSTRQMSRL
jgi:hypothetical protein